MAISCTVSKIWYLSGHTVLYPSVFDAQFYQ